MAKNYFFPSRRDADRNGTPVCLRMFPGRQPLLDKLVVGDQDDSQVRVPKPITPG